MRTRDTQRLARTGLTCGFRDEGHRALIVDLQKIRELAVRQLAHGTEKARRQILRSDVREELPLLCEILGPQRPQEHGATVPLHCFFQFFGIRADRKSIRAASLRKLHANACAEREYA